MWIFSNVRSNSLVSVNQILVAVANEHGLNIFHVDVTQAVICAKQSLEIYMKLPHECGSMSGNTVRLNRWLYGL